MDDPIWMALSPAGNQLYVANYAITFPGGSGVAIFKRELPPLCAPVSASVRSGHTITVHLPCSDPNFDSLSLKVVHGPSHGQLGPLSGRHITYTAAPAFTGVDHFTFRASDGRLRSAPAVATIKVTAPPAP
jgi:hypothetical protein